ncbi:MAG: hypothetical protein O6934_12770, partial [SAR324 cluster bacterium]|nr:hypothetical protein [SAR324 cluster bacterium]
MRPMRVCMEAVTCVLVTASMQTRIGRIIAEYGGGRDAATLVQLEAALGALTPFFGGQRIAGMTEKLRAGDLAAVVNTLLMDYYDPRYLHGMRGYSYALEVSSESLHEAVAALRKFGPTTQSRGEAAVANVANARL